MQANHGISTVSAAVDVPETATENEARNSCGSCCTCACVTQAMCGRNGCVPLTLQFLLFILPVCEMVFGALLYDKFQQYSMIPTFLLVLGSFSLPLAVNVVFPKLIREPVRTVLMFFNFLFLLGWFIAGHVWTFQRFSLFWLQLDRLTSTAVSFIRINYVLLFLIIVYICLYCHRRRYGVRNQQSGTYTDVNKFYKQNMATCGFTQSMNPTTTGQQQMWIQVPTEDPMYLPSAPPMGPTSY